MVFRQVGRRRFVSVVSSAVILILISTVSVGCKQKFPNGHFEGILSQSIHSQFSRNPVGIDISYQNKTGLIEVKNTHRNIILVLEVTNYGSSGFSLSIPAIQ